MTLEDSTYGWPTEMIVKAVRAQWRIVEVPVTCRPRTGGRSKISGTVRGHRPGDPSHRRTIARHGAYMSDVQVVGRTAAVIMAQEQRQADKTRLCPPLSPSDAARLYEALLHDTITLVSRLPGVRLAVAVTPPVGRLGDPSPPAARRTGAAGRRPRHRHPASVAPLSSCSPQGCSRVMAINSDGPTLPVAYLERAEALLDRHDVVLGPSEDGGYYLVGLRQSVPGLFQGIAWSTCRVMSQTMDRAGTLGLSSRCSRPGTTSTRGPISTAFVPRSPLCPRMN